jgi:preprotein translocase subunit SecB
LYPYLRSNIADIVSRAGFQAIHLAEINFHAMYEQRLAQASEGAKGAAEGNADADKSKIILPN